MVKRIGNGLWIYEQGEDFLVVKGYCPNEVYDKSEADSYIRLLDNHHKYKRCLTMADLCKARYDEEDAKVNGCGASWEYISKEMKYWERWHKRWLELAEKFKEAK